MFLVIIFYILVTLLSYGSATMTVKRVGVSFEPKLLDKFDTLIKKGIKNE